MHFLRTKKLHIATLFISVFIGGFAWVLVGPALLNAQSTEEFHLPTQSGDRPVSSGDFGDPFATPADTQYTGYPGTVAPGTGTQPTPTEQQQGAVTAAANALKPQKDQFSCIGWTDTLVPVPYLNFNGCVAQVMNFAMWVSARTLWIAGVLLNMTLHYTLNLNTLLERLPVVDIGWKVLRDLANIVFIFVALWCGMSITLGIGDNGKKAWGLLAELVLVALFMNFSLFITKAVVDVSNVAALHFYSLIVEPGKEGDYDSGLSESFLYGLKLSTLYNTNDRTQAGLGADNVVQSVAASGATKTPLSFTNIILIGLFGSLFIIVTAWVFFAAAIMFIYRAITLIMLMMLSPLAFVGLILPGASGMAHQWWSKLWSQAFFAPLYLALAYVVVKTINAPAFQESFNTAGFASAITDTGAGSIAIIFNFVILIGLMVGCLVVAESLGAKGSDMAMAGWEKIKGTVQSGVVGVTGAATRQLIKTPSQLMQGVGNLGAKFTTGRTNTFFKKLGGAGKWVDPRYLEERAGKSKWGNTMAGKALRSVTTGAVANVKIGNQSLEEAYEEGEEMSSKRREIGYGNTARKNAEQLKPLHEQEQHLLDEKLKAEEEEKRGEQALAQAKASATPAEQQQMATAQQNVVTAEAELEKAKTPPPTQDELKQLEQNRETAKKALGDAQNTPGVSPQVIKQLELNRKVADDALFAAEKKAKAGPATPAQLKQFEQNRETAKKALKQATPKQITAAEAALATAKGEGFVKAKEELDAAQKLEDTDPTKAAKVRAAQEKVDAERKKGGMAVAEDAIESFEQTNRKDIGMYTAAIKDALAQMSIEAFLDLPKVYFESPALMDLAVLGQDKHDALMKSEHFTKSEKEEYTHARWERTERLANRRKVRNDRYLQELPEHQKQTEAYQAEVKKIEVDVGLPQLEETYEKEVAVLTANLKTLADKLADAEHDSTLSATEIAAKKKEVTDAEQAIENKKYAFTKDKAKRIAARDKKIKDVGLVPPVMKTAQPGWEESGEIRKALRNILGKSEVINLYRYNRKAFGNEMIADTIKQATWNEVRRSGEIDSNSIETARVIKRHYIKDSLYLGSGLDAVQMHGFEESDQAGAYDLLKDLGKEMKKRGIEGYKEWIKSGSLQALLKEKGLDNLSADIDVQLDRHASGTTMYKEVAPNLANDEFEMMPGMMREHPMSMNYYDQSTIVPFTKRDIENTLPMAEFFIEQFKRHVDSGGKVKISDGNLRILKWFVNENQGQGFTQFEHIRDDLKDSFEVIKRLIASSARAARSTKYPTHESALERTKGVDPFTSIRSAGDLKNQR